MAAPTAWMARAATSTPRAGASDAISDARVKIPTPTNSTLLRPQRSAIRPAGTRTAAKTIAYALSTQDSAPAPDPGKEAPMPSRATLTMKKSSWAMNATAPSTHMIRHLRGSLRWSMGAARVAASVIVFSQSRLGDPFDFVAWPASDLAGPFVGHVEALDGAALETGHDLVQDDVLEMLRLPVFLECLTGGIAFEKDVVEFVIELAVDDEGDVAGFPARGFDQLRQ